MYRDDDPGLPRRGVQGLVETVVVANLFFVLGLGSLVRGGTLGRKRETVVTPE